MFKLGINDTYQMGLEESKLGFEKDNWELEEVWGLGKAIKNKLVTSIKKALYEPAYNYILFV